MRTLTFVRLLGRGSSGTVYLATLQDAGRESRPIAIRVLKAPHQRREAWRERLAGAARQSSLIRDPALVPIEEVLHFDGLDALALPYQEAASLALLLRGRRLEARLVFTIASRVAALLASAHQQGVHHGNLKPTNVGLDPSGQVKVFDLGLAMAIFDADDARTQGLALGSLNYLSPDVLAGGRAGPEADCYALGLLIWESLTGQSWGMPQLHQDRFEARLGERLAQLDPAGSTVVPLLRGLLAWDPQARPSAAEAQRQLHLLGTDPSALAAYAAREVPQRLARADGERDELVGRTVVVAKPSPDRAEAAPVPSTAPAAGGGWAWGLAAVVILVLAGGTVGVVALAVVAAAAWFSLS